MVILKAMVQGSNRLQRGLNYIGYLAGRRGGRAPPFGFFAGAHNFPAFVASAKFMEWAYGTPAGAWAALGLRDPDLAAG
jgi:hypothetical protein